MMTSFPSPWLVKRVLTGCLQGEPPLCAGAHGRFVRIIMPTFCHIMTSLSHSDLLHDLNDVFYRSDDLAWSATYISFVSIGFIYKMHYLIHCQDVILPCEHYQWQKANREHLCLV